MTKTLRHLSYFMLASFGVVALTLGYWSIARRGWLISRDDNPRRVLAVERIQRGDILDRAGTIVATSDIGEDGRAQRRYPNASVAPVVGYYSLRFGEGGIEAVYDGLLSGESGTSPDEKAVNQLLHRPIVGGDVRLTIDLDLQTVVQDALGDQMGAVVVLNGETGEILALGSTPSYDPNLLNEQWEALSDDPRSPLLNRATQGTYQPGTILQGVIYGTALNTGATTFDASWYGPESVVVDGALLPCAVAGSVSTLGDAFAQSCPGPLESIGVQIERSLLVGALTDFGLLQPVSLDVGNAPTAPSSPTASARLIALGQGDITVQPLQMALVTAAFSNQGRIPAVHIVDATRLPDGTWQDEPQRTTPRATISTGSIEQVKSLMEQSTSLSSDVPLYGYEGLAVASSAPTYNAWFIGFAYQIDGTPLIVTVLLEDSQQSSQAAAIGRQVLEASLLR